MFPSLLIQPEVSTFSPFIGYLVVGFGFLLSFYKKIFITLIFLLLVLFPLSSFSFGFVPGGCGTSCLAQKRVWGNSGAWNYPPVYYYPYTPEPLTFYSNPNAFYPMLDTWQQYYRPFGPGSSPTVN